MRTRFYVPAIWRSEGLDYPSNLYDSVVEGNSNPKPSTSLCWPPSPLATLPSRHPPPPPRKSPRPRQCWPLIGQRSVYKPCPGIAKALGDHLRDSSHHEEQNESSSTRTGRSQQLEIPPSLNSKQAACFSSYASFSTNAGFSPGAGISTPARILLSAWFSKSTWFSLAARISQSAWFSLATRISQYAWFSLAARIFQSAWFSLAARIFTYFQYFIFCILYWVCANIWLARLF